MLRGLGAETVVEEPDVAALFAHFPLIAQYPTHWQHDLILPYEELPTYEGLRESGLERVLNYRGRPNVVGVCASLRGNSDPAWPLGVSLQDQDQVHSAGEA
jgi:hypothetical protein